MPNKTLKKLKEKIFVMQSIYLCLLILLYTVAIWGFVDTFSDLLEFPYSPLHISFFLSFIGIGLGVLFYYISLFKSNVKNYIITAIVIIISIIFVIPYLELKIDALRESAMLLIKIGILLGFCTVPTTSVYALLKKQKDTLLVSGLVIMFFFCFIRVLKGNFVFSEDQNELLVLFFITFICFLELGTKSFQFDSVIHKLMPNEDVYDIVLLRFNKVLNRYFVNISLFFVICYILTIIIFWNNASIGLFNAEGFIGIDFSSIHSTFVLVILLMAGMFIFWFLAPYKRTKKA